MISRTLCKRAGSASRAGRNASGLAIVSEDRMVMASARDTIGANQRGISSAAIQLVRRQWLSRTPVTRSSEVRSTVRMF